MPKPYAIFICYRRDDASGHAGRLYDRLSGHFGEDQIFMDIELEPGYDFVEAIENAVGSCEVFIAVIGRHWLSCTDERGEQRIRNPEDFVRLEIAAALERNIRVIPVLVHNAAMPRSTDLPDALAKLARRNAIEISDTRWRADTERLIKVLENALRSAYLHGDSPAVQHLTPVSEVTPPRPESAPPTPTQPKSSAVEGLYYSKDHEWIELKGGVGTIGISDYAQNSLSDIVYVELPKVGDVFSAHESFGSIESVKAVTEIFTPVSGEVIEINESLLEEPEKLNTDPMGKGWIARIRLKDPGEINSLLTVEEYQEFTGNEGEV